MPGKYDGHTFACGVFFALTASTFLWDCSVFLFFVFFSLLLLVQGETPDKNS